MAPGGVGVGPGDPFAGQTRDGLEQTTRRMCLDGMLWVVMAVDSSYLGLGKNLIPDLMQGKQMIKQVLHLMCPRTEPHFSVPSKA